MIEFHVLLDKNMISVHVLSDRNMISVHVLSDKEIWYNFMYFWIKDMSHILQCFEVHCSHCCPAQTRSFCKTVSPLQV